MTAQPSGQPSEQPPRWRATRGPFMVSDGGAHPAAPATPAPPTAYYPGGPHGGYFPGGPHGPGGNPPEGSHGEIEVLTVVPEHRKSLTALIGGTALILLGLWVVAVVFPWDGHLPKGNGPVLNALAGLILLGFGVHLLVNDPPRNKPDSKSEETARTINLVLLALGAILSVLLLKEDNPALLLPSVLAAVTLFVAGFVSLLKPKD